MDAAFIDSGYLIALSLARDEYHSVAHAHWQGVLAVPCPLVTTSFVFDEVATFLNRRGHHAKAVEVGQALLDSRWIECVTIDERLFDSAWRIFVQQADKRWSFTDCASFVVMRERGLTLAFGFDEHFRQAGFTLEPAP